jgi:hypothetical protein
VKKQDDEIERINLFGSVDRAIRALGFEPNGTLRERVDQLESVAIRLAGHIARSTDFPTLDDIRREMVIMEHMAETLEPLSPAARYRVLLWCNQQYFPWDGPMRLKPDVFGR